MPMTPKQMIFKLLYRRWPLQKQVDFLKRKAILIGSRTREKRKVYIYMYRNMFAEVIFLQDDPNQPAESARIVKGLKNLNSYLENEFKNTF
jgi:hypothetical protein